MPTTNDEQAMRILDALYDDDDDNPADAESPWAVTPNETSRMRAAADGAVGRAFARYRASVRLNRESVVDAGPARRASVTGWTREAMLAALEALKSRGVQLAFRKRSDGDLTDDELRSILQDAQMVADLPEEPGEGGAQ